MFVYWGLRAQRLQRSFCAHQEVNTARGQNCIFIPVPGQRFFFKSIGYWELRIEVNMKINLLSTVLQQKMTSLMHNILVHILPIFFRYIVTGEKRLLGVLLLMPPTGRFAPIILCLSNPELTKSFHDSDTARCKCIHATVMQNIMKGPSCTHC